MIRDRWLLGCLASTSAVARLVRDGVKETNYFDAIVRNKYKVEADKLRTWRGASRIERPRSIRV